jgi:hypothetical protein
MDVTLKALSAAVIRLTLESVAKSEASPALEALEADDDSWSNVSTDCSFAAVAIDARRQLEIDIMQADAVTTAPSSPCTAACEEDVSQYSCESAIAVTGCSRAQRETIVTSKALSATVIRLTLESLAKSEASQAQEILEHQDDSSSSVPTDCSCRAVAAGAYNPRMNI